MNNGSNLFAQMLSNIDFSAFQNIVNAHEGDKGTKGFSCRDQLVTMLFAHIAGLHKCNLPRLGYERNKFSRIARLL